MSETRRQVLSAMWTPEMRAKQSERTRAQYQAWAEANPEKAALVDKTWSDIKAGVTDRPGCEECGRPMNPTYDWQALVVTGWRCRSCQPRSRS